jgi:hypothetical protein
VTSGGEEWIQGGLNQPCTGGRDSERSYRWPPRFGSRDTLTVRAKRPRVLLSHALARGHPNYGR